MLSWWLVPFLPFSFLFVASGSAQAPIFDKSEQLRASLKLFCAIIGCVIFGWRGGLEPDMCIIHHWSAPQRMEVCYANGAHY